VPAQWCRTVEHTGTRRQITASCQVKAKGVYSADIDIRFFDAGGKPLLDEPVVSIGSDGADARPVAHDWREYSGTVTVPEETATIQIALRMHGGGTVWFDDLKLDYVGPENAREAKVEEGPRSYALRDGFETGHNVPDGWKRMRKVDGVRCFWDKKVACEGKASLCLKKTPKTFLPIAGWYKTLPCEQDAPGLRLSVKVKAENAYKAVVNVQFLDAYGADMAHRWAVYIGARSAADPPVSHGWKEYEGTVPIVGGATKIRIALQIYGPGTVWFDDLRLSYVSE